MNIISRNKEVYAGDIPDTHTYCLLLLIDTLDSDSYESAKHLRVFLVKKGSRKNLIVDEWLLDKTSTDSYTKLAVDVEGDGVTEVYFCRYQPEKIETVMFDPVE